MSYRIFAIVFFFLATTATADRQSARTVVLARKSLPADLRCSEEFSKTLELSDQGQDLFVEIPELASSPIVNSGVVCQTLLRRWAQQLESRGQTEVTLALEPTNSRQNEGLTYRMISTDLSEYCQSIGLCSSGVLQWFNLDPELKNCQPHFSWNTAVQRAIPHSLRPDPEVIHHLEIELFPFMPLGESLRRELTEGDTPILASTMSAGNSTLLELLRSYRGSSSRAIIALDAGLMFGSDQSLMLSQNFPANSGISLLPITSGRSFSSIYHWKGIVPLVGDQSTLSSMNLSSPLKTPYTDVLYHFKEPEVTADLRALFASAMIDQCQNPSDYQCLSLFAHPDAEQQRRLNKLFEGGCSTLKEFFPSGAPVRKRRYFMQPQDTDLEYLATSMIARAKTEIVMSSHKFSLPGIAQALAQAQARGVRVVALATKPSRLPKGTPVSFYYYERNRTSSRRVPNPHMKTLIIDRQQMLFGTGNFSRNAFGDARELFAITDDPSAITKILQVLESILRVYCPKCTPLGAISPDQHWVVARKPRKATEEKDPNWDRLAHTSASSAPWLAHYRLVDRSFVPSLIGCGLPFLFIPQDDFEACVSQTAL